MEVTYVAAKIEEKIRLLEKGRSELTDAIAEAKVAVAEYDRDLAIAMIQLRNGKEMTLDGERIQNPPATLIEKIAKGICWQSRIRADGASSTQTACIKKLASIETEMNGYQSIYRHLATT
jgi:hypothetical protein